MIKGQYLEPRTQVQQVKGLNFGSIQDALRDENIRNRAFANIPYCVVMRGQYPEPSGAVFLQPSQRFEYWLHSRRILGRK